MRTPAEFARGLRELAEFYEANPNFPVPYQDAFNVFVYTKSEMVYCARALGRVDKAVTDSFFEIKRKFGPFTLAVNIKRNAVCERVKVGEREVPEQHLPAREAETVPAHTEDIFEWKCPEALLGTAAKPELQEAQSEADPAPEIPF